ncbi:MAG: ATP phosphoribosyltransferase [Chloroflexaceae bacterium]|nr:ATP phosphoribosyltransferase [Chloroflexaceae bacterium]
MAEYTESPLRLAVPSKGRLEQQTLDFLAAAGLKVHRPNERQYIASLPAVTGVSIIFQRAGDIPDKVNGGSTDERVLSTTDAHLEHTGQVELGITGYDLVCEQQEAHPKIVVIYPELGFGRCQLVLAVPEGWLDVTSIGDLAEVAVHFKERKGRYLRIATKHANLTKNWLYQQGIIHFSLVKVEGAIEAAPSMGYADIIADVSSSGTTLRENRLKTITGGTIIDSQTCLIGNRTLLRAHPARLEQTRTIIELIEAYLRSKKYVSVTANICGPSPEAIARQLNRDSTFGLHGPTIARVYGSNAADESWYSVTVVITEKSIMPTVDHLRRAGGKDITVLPITYFFESASSTYERLLKALQQDSA